MKKLEIYLPSEPESVDFDGYGTFLACVAGGLIAHPRILADYIELHEPGVGSTIIRDASGQ